MSGGRAVLEADGRCSFFDEIAERTTGLWPTVGVWAAEWIAQRKAEAWGPAEDFANAMTSEPTSWAVEVLRHLAEFAAAQSMEEPVLAWIGAGPLENLLSHHGHGALVLAGVDQAARQSPPFRAALSNVWLSDDVPEHVRHRLATLGARDFVAERAMTESGRSAYKAARDARGLGWG